MKKIASILIGFFFILSCSKDDKLFNDSIIGKWEWIETINAWTQIKYTPEKEGYTLSTIYKDNNTAEYYKNNELFNSETYLVKENPENSNFRILEVHEMEFYFTVRNDTLILGQAYVDGPTSFYIRVQ